MKGDVIYVKRMITKEERNSIKQIFPIGPLANFLKFYKHYGIDLGDGNVIHFSGKDILISGEDVSIRIVPIREFLRGEKREVDNFVKYVYDRNMVIVRALKELGKNFDGYNVLRNNCEHFAYWCATGRRSSRQVFFLDDDRSFLQKSLEILMENTLKIGKSLKEIEKYPARVN